MMKHSVVNGNVVKVGNFLNRHAVEIAVVSLVTVTMAGVVFAALDAETLWSTLSSTIQKWVMRLGGVIMFIGGIQVGVGWQNDDSARKSAGFNTIVAGAIVLAVGALAGTFFA